LNDLDKILQGRMDEFVKKYHATTPGLDNSDWAVAQMLAYEDMHDTKGNAEPDPKKKEIKENKQHPPFELARQDSLLLQWKKEEEMLKQLVDEQQGQLLLLETTTKLQQQHSANSKQYYEKEKKEDINASANLNGDGDDDYQVQRVLPNNLSKEELAEQLMERKLSRSDIRRHRLKSSQHYIQHASVLLTGIVSSNHNSPTLPAATAPVVPQTFKAESPSSKKS